MKNPIKINNCIIYFPDKNLLQNLLFTNKKVILNEPSARCLDILLMSSSDIVTHQELYTCGWGNTSVEPTPNTLYQNILLIRKALREISDDNLDYIITTPRKGFYFNKNIPVEVVINDNVYLVQDESRADTHLENNRPASKNKVNNNKRKYSFIIYISFWLSVLFIAYQGILYCTAKPLNYFDNYQFVRHNDNCNIFFNKNNEMSISKRNEENIAHSNKAISCNEYPYRYITISRFSNDLFLLLCNKNDTSDNEMRCISGRYK
ncbi:transcriptional regulator [Morganella morganii]